MNIEDLKNHAMKAMMEDGPEAALRIYFEEYEQTVASIRAAREASDSSVGTKKVLEALEFSQEEEDATFHTMQDVRQVVYNALIEQPRLSVLLYEALRDYASNEVKDFRDDVIRQAKRDFELPDSEEETELPDIDSETLKSLREQAEAFWVVAGRPELSPSDKELKDNPYAPKTKQLKDGSHKLSTSNLPKNFDPKEVNEQDKSVKHSRLRYEVDGHEVPAGTPLSAVGLWYVSSPQWTLTVDEIKREVVRQSDHAAEYKDVGDFEIEINGHTLRRYRENI